MVPDCDLWELQKVLVHLHWKSYLILEQLSTLDTRLFLTVLNSLVYCSIQISVLDVSVNF